MLFLVVLVVTLIVLALEWLFGVYKTVMVEELSQHAAESAALGASIDLGKIVVNDPYFGFISLSDQAPIGRATRSLDGQSQAVLGINTILGSARLQLLIAQDSGSAELLAVAEQEAQAAERASRLLAQTLQFAVVADDNNPVYGFDADGNKVQVLKDAKQLYLANLGTAFGSMPDLTDFQLSLGWSDCGGWTGTPLPRPYALADVPEGDTLKDQYKADVDIPAGLHHFYFASLARQAALVDPRHFMRPDGKRICSTIRVDVNLLLNHRSSHSQTAQTWNDGFNLCASACAQPAGGEDLPELGALTVSLPNGFVAGVDNLNSLMIDKQLCQTRAQDYRSHNGDYPYDNQSCMVQTNPAEDKTTAAGAFARGFHDWLRTAHCHVRIDSAVECLNVPFEKLPTEYDEETTNQNDIPASNLYRFQIVPDGRIVVSRKNREIYQREVLTENQELSINQISLNSNLLLLSCHDYVNSLGTVNGGKHAGRALPVGRTEHATQLIGYNYPPSDGFAWWAPANSITFGESDDGNLGKWTYDPFHSGGLAVCFDIANSSIFGGAH
jgi:hypothetical protein